MPVFGEKSLAKLEGVDPRLVEVAKLAITLTKQDFSVIYGLRSQAEQDALYAQGRTKPGKIVTWVRHSKHTEGKAIDTMAFPASWDGHLYLAIRDAMFTAAKELGVKLRWGGDWDGDGVTERGETDLGHFELGE